MTRRLFLSTWAGVAAAAPVIRSYAIETIRPSDAGQAARFALAGRIVLDAIIAAHMPQLLLVSDAGEWEGSLEIAPRDPRLFELREYDSGAGSQLRSIFLRHGIHPAVSQHTTFLIPFDSFSSREQAWRGFAADPEWAKVRSESTLRQVAIYRAANVNWRLFRG